MLDNEFIEEFDAMWRMTDETPYSKEKNAAKEEWSKLKSNIDTYVYNTLASGEEGIVIRGQSDERTDDTIKTVLGNHLGGLVLEFLKKMETYDCMFYTIDWLDILDYIVAVCEKNADILSQGKEVYCMNSDYLLDSDTRNNICYTSSPTFFVQYLSEVYAILQECFMMYGNVEESVYYDIVKEHICPAYICSEQHPTLPFLAAYLLALDQVPLLFKYVGEGYLVELNPPAQRLLAELAALKAEISEDGEVKEASLESYQHQVGGLIEILYLSDDAVLVVNEEGKMVGLPPNRRFGCDILVGNILIVGSKGEHIIGLSDENIRKYTEQFAEPEEIDPNEVEMFIEGWFF